MAKQKDPPDVLTEPMTEPDVRENIAANRGRLVVRLALPLHTIACSSDNTTLDGLNDVVEDLILADGFNFLEDIGYAVVGFVPPDRDNGQVIVEVTARVEFTTAEDFDLDSDEEDEDEEDEE